MIWSWHEVCLLPAWGIVHLSGGVAGLAGTIVLGPRKGRFENPEEFETHNLPLVVFGTFALWFGWYGFNPGSTLGMHDSATGAMAAQVAMNTTLSAATGGITVFIFRYFITKKYDVGGLCNGILAGLVSITAGCGNMECGSAFATGLVGGIVYQARFCSWILKCYNGLCCYSVYWCLLVVRLHFILCSYSINVSSCCNLFNPSIDNCLNSGCIHAPPEAQDWWPSWCCPCPRLLWYLGCSGMWIFRLGQGRGPSVLVLYFFTVKVWVFFLQLVSTCCPHRMDRIW